MKKEDVTGLLVYLVILAVAIIFGFTVLKEFAAGSGFETGVFIGYVAGAIVSGVVLNGLLFELGHLAGAKAGRYNVISFNCLGFCFYKKDNTRKFKMSSFDGLTGETKIVPKPNQDKECNPNPYLLFGPLFFIVEFVIVLVLFITLNNASLGVKSSLEARTAYFLLVIGVIGLMIFIYDIVPIKLDSINDGYRFRLVSNPRNREAFNELLRVEYAISNGEQNVQVKTFETITNFTADLNLNKVYTLLDSDKYEEALPYIDTILKNKENISNDVYISTKAQKIYIVIMTKSLEEALKIYDEEVPASERREISENKSMSSIRAYILMSGLLDKSLSETERAVNKVLKAYKHTPKSRQPIELKLYNGALKRVIQAHPNWNLEGYLLEEN